MDIQHIKNVIVNLRLEYASIKMYLRNLDGLITVEEIDEHLEQMTRIQD